MLEINNRYVLNLSIVIPTYNRPEILQKTLQSISLQQHQPYEIIIIDGSKDFEKSTSSMWPNLSSIIVHEKAIELGAAKQRNQGIALANTDIIGFFDDDIILEKDCIKILWDGLQKHQNCGGINAVITNQSYHNLGSISKMFYRLLGGDTSKSLAGKCIGPAICFLPSLETKVEYAEVDWLNLGCTFYRKDALPKPVFDHHFVGYSLMEDLALSLRVGQNWKLITASQAHIYHDSQPSEGKSNIFINSEMELVNRFYIMKHIRNQTGLKDYVKLFLQQLFSAVSSKKILSIKYLKGKYSALKKIQKI
ncbi:MAG: glycosyltransferase [Pedobacter sp.]|uniref:glycosyltransferase family 2 protein n=1 Tax=Pedobacter sp. TaxID=1411316 RepID=UPI0028089BDF|nr:glycosyltransferase [Pedobacter sp.]MDQ8004877.1 glycosyltransferase [Pedobacter sp.]